MADAPTLAEITGAAPGERALADPWHVRTWHELEARTNAVGHALDAAGVAPGSHAIVLGTNRVAYVEALIGAMRAGMVVTPVKSGWTASEVDYVADDAGTKVMLTDLPVGRDVAARRGLTVVEFDAVDGMVDQFGEAPLPRDRHGYRMSYTSGTTGRPKGVRLAGAGAAPFAEAFPAGRRICEVLAMPMDGPHQSVSALYHGAPLAFALGAMGAGCEMRIMEHWDPSVALDLLEDGVRSTSMVPTMFRHILALPENRLDAFRAPALACILHGGEPCPRALKQAMLDRFGPVLTEYYGYSEGGFTRATAHEWLERPGTVGQALLGMEIEIRSEDGARLLGPNEQGVVYFRSPGERRFSYVNEPTKTEAAFQGEAFTVGDVGWVDEDGWLYISGRTADVIVSGGVNVYPAEIEDVIAGLAELRDVCVVGGPDEQRGETPVAVAVPAPGVAPEEVRAAIDAAAREALASYQWPRDVVIVDDLPRDGTGKLLRREVRERLWEGRDSNFANPAR